MRIVYESPKLFDRTEGAPEQHRHNRYFAPLCIRLHFGKRRERAGVIANRESVKRSVLGYWIVGDAMDTVNVLAI